MIDVWNPLTFDAELHSLLTSNAKLVRSYVNREKKIFLTYDHRPTSKPSLLRPENRHASAFHNLTLALANLMKARAIRAWHYCRLTDAETALLKRDGIHLSAVDTLRTRLDALVAADEIDAAIAAQLFEKSPFQGDQARARTGKFWLVSDPQAINDTGVTRLLRYWGGEVASFWTDDERLLAPLETIGHPRILEVAVPLDQTHQSYRAGEAVIASYALSLIHI